MNNVVSLKCARIREDLENFSANGVVPQSLRKGEYTVVDINYCNESWPKHIQYAANHLVAKYHLAEKTELIELKKHLRKDYADVIDNLETNRPMFMFPTILGQYRPDINPVRALYYEIREMTRDFNPRNDRHLWLMSIVQDNVFNDALLNALKHDVSALKTILEKYYVVVLLKDKSIPLELFHAKQEIQEFRHYYNVFKIARDWTPN